MGPIINDSVVIDELAALHEQYEAALVSNDADTLVKFFWDSELALRFGVAESLYGAQAINEFRRNRPSIDLSRTVSNLRIVAFGDDCGVITLEFERQAATSPLSDRIMFSYVDHAAALIGLPLEPQYREGVRANLERAVAIARPLLAAGLSEEVESAPVFQP